MGLRHSVAAGQHFFLYLCGLPATTSWSVPQPVLVYVDGAAFLGRGTDDTFNARRAEVDVELGADEPFGWHPVFGGMRIDIDANSWSLKDAAIAKLSAEVDDATLTGRVAFARTGRALIALRYLALPLGLLPSAWRVTAAVARAGVARLDMPFAPPDGWRQELRTVAALCALPRQFRRLPERTVQVAVDASPMGCVMVGRPYSARGGRQEHRQRPWRRRRRASTWR